MLEFHAAELLEFYNPAKQRVSCVGYAPSKRRRCENPIAAHNIDRGTVLSMELSSLAKKPGSLQFTLYEIAECFLCRRYHQGQAEDMVNKWQQKIQDLAKAQQATRQRTAQEDAWAAAMVRNAKVDLRPATLKHEDSGYASFSDDDDDDLSLLPQSSPQAQDTGIPDQDDSIPDDEEEEEEVATAPTIPMVLAVSASLPAIALPGTNESGSSVKEFAVPPGSETATQAPTIAHENIEDADVERGCPSTNDASTQTMLGHELISTSNSRSIEICLPRPKKGTALWLSTIEGRGRTIVFWICMAFVVDMLMRVR